MQKLDEIKNSISESEEKQKNLGKEYAEKLAQLTKALKEEYSTKISNETNMQKYLNSEIYSFWNMVRIVDKFDIDVLGNALAKLLSQTTDQEYLYGCLKNYLYDHSTIPGGCSAIIFPKGKIKMDENMHSGMTIGDLSRDKSIIILKPFVNSDKKEEISFYNYSLMSKDNCYVTPNIPFACLQFPQIKEFIDYVLETHAIYEWEQSHIHTQINEEELDIRLAEYLSNYYLKKAEDYDNYSKTLSKKIK